MNDVTMQKHFLAASTLVMNCLLVMLLSKPVIFCTSAQYNIKKKSYIIIDMYLDMNKECQMMWGQKLLMYSIYQYDKKKEVNKSLGVLLYNL